MYKQIIMAGLLTGTMLVCACTTNPRYKLVAADLGRSHETARFHQIINPEAGLNAMPVKGIDGQAGEYIYKNYQDGFKEKTPPTPVFNLNLGPGGK